MNLCCVCAYFPTEEASCTEAGGTGGAEAAAGGGTRCDAGASGGPRATGKGFGEAADEVVEGKRAFGGLAIGYTTTATTE